MEIGIYTFVDVGVGGSGVTPAQRIPELLEEIALADQVGLDFYGIGEHHRDRLGFDPVDAGPLAAARAFSPGTALFGVHLSRDQMERALSIEVHA